MKALRLIYIFVSIALLYCLVSCSPYRGYGVLIWKNENLPFKIGDLLNIISIFKVDNYYEVDQEGTYIQVPMWQVEFFESKDEALKFQQSLREYINSYVFTLQYNGLPIRKEPKSNSPMIFRLKPGKLAKVLGRDQEKTNISGLESYWYRVLTEEGYKGYIFGYYLQLIEDVSSVKDTITALTNQDPNLDKFLKNIWRPRELKEMLESDKIDLDYINRNYGLIPKPAEKKIILITEDLNKEYRYSEIKKITSDTYEVLGTDLKIQIKGLNTIVVSYFHENNFIIKEFVLIEKDIENLTRFEQDRWQDLYYNILNRGKVLFSSNYGKIEFYDDFRFNWTDFKALEMILPLGVKGRGSVSFGRKLGPLLFASYTGALTFYFDEEPKFPLTFVYLLRESSITFFHVTNENITSNNVIKNIDSNALVLNFDFQK